MKPGILLICDPSSVRAQARVSDMLAGLGVDLSNKAALPAGMIRAGTGDHWAAAVIAPPAHESSCGADIHSDGKDVVIWAGEMFLPEHWNLPKQYHDRPQQAISTTLLERLRASGTDAIAELDGAFCGAWYEYQRREWHVFNDRFGLLPVFYHARKSHLAVGPTVTATFSATNEPLRISEAGVTDLIRCENMVDDHTLIESIHWLEPAHELQWNEQQSKSRRYWDFRDASDPTTTPDEAIADYVAALRQSIMRHGSCNRPLMLGISGGLDSRMFLAMCTELGRSPSCFTAGWPFSDDVRYGRRAAGVAGVKHETVSLEAEGLGDHIIEAIIDTDGLHSAAHMAPAAAMRSYLREHPGAVLLEGYMQGVLGGAYVPADDDLATDTPPHQHQWARCRLHSGGDVPSVNSLLRPDVATRSYDRWRERIDNVYRNAPSENPLARAEYTVASGRSGRIDTIGTALLRDNVLVRNPSCDRAMLDWHAATPAGLRRGKRIFMDVIRKHFPAMARVQRTSYSGLPIAEDRWLREYCWQREKLHRVWTGCTHPWTLKWGTGGKAIRAWTFQTLRTGGRLDDLVASDARILNWVDRHSLLSLWDEATHDALQGGPLLTLATIETMIRHLEGRNAHVTRPRGNGFWFERFAVAADTRTDNIATCPSAM